MKTKKIISKAYVRSPQSEYVRDICALIRVMQLLGIVTDVRMRIDPCLDGKSRWALSVEVEVKDE